jgi:hypothetical protein
MGEMSSDTCLRTFKGNQVTLDNFGGLGSLFAGEGQIGISKDVLNHGQ